MGRRVGNGIEEEWNLGPQCDLRISKVVGWELNI